MLSAYLTFLTSSIADLGDSSQILPNAHAHVSLTTTLESYISLMRVGIAFCTRGTTVVLSKPPRSEHTEYRKYEIINQHRGVELYQRYLKL